MLTENMKIWLILEGNKNILLIKNIKIVRGNGKKWSKIGLIWYL